MKPILEGRAATLGLGTAPFQAGYSLGAKSLSDPGAVLLRRALDRGIRYFDTAPSYGTAERSLGQIGIPSSPGVRVCTKIKHAEDGGIPAVVQEARHSLDRLAASRVDTFMLHSVGDAVLRAEGPSLKVLRDQGFCDRIGASTYGIDDAVAALAQDWCDSLQVEFSILNQAIVPALRPVRRVDQEIIVRSVLCKGLLTDRRRAAPALLTPVSDTVDALELLARDWGYSLQQLAIRFTLDTPGVDVVVVGVANEPELTAALEAWNAPALTPEQHAELGRFDRSATDVVHPELWHGIGTRQ